MVTANLREPPFSNPPFARTYCISFHVIVDKAKNVKFLTSFQSLKHWLSGILLGQTQKYTLPSLALWVQIIDFENEKVGLLVKKESSQLGLLQSNSQQWNKVILLTTLYLSIFCSFSL